MTNFIIFVYFKYLNYLFLYRLSMFSELISLKFFFSPFIAVSPIYAVNYLLSHFKCYFLHPTILRYSLYFSSRWTPFQNFYTYPLFVIILLLTNKQTYGIELAGYCYIHVDLLLYRMSAQNVLRNYVYTSVVYSPARTSLRILPHLLCSLRLFTNF